MEEMVNVKKKEEQRRRWLEELDKQRDETTERRRREKLLQSQVVELKLGRVETRWERVQSLN